MSSIQLTPVAAHNLDQLKQLHTVLFPNTSKDYDAAFYNDVLLAGKFSQLVYCNGALVGTICCRIETSKLCIMTLGCLECYRKQGIGSILMNRVLDLVEQDGCFDGVFLYVHVKNNKAVSFYKKFGFEIVDKVEGYYWRLTTPDGYLLQKAIKKPFYHMDRRDSQ